MKNLKFQIKKKVAKIQKLGGGQLSGQSVYKLECDLFIFYQTPQSVIFALMCIFKI